MADFKYADDDSVLLTAVRQGDIRAYNALFKRYYPLLCVYCSRFIEVEEVEDIVQEVMTWLWEKRAEIQFETSLNAYLYKMVYNRTLNQNLRNEKKVHVEGFFQQRLEEEVQCQDVHDIEELINMTNHAIEKLPVQYRETFMMHRLDGMSYKEIAEQLQISPKTVDYRIQQALKILRVKLKDYLPLILMHLLTSH